jgi:hypothetical protein
MQIRDPCPLVLAVNKLGIDDARQANYRTSFRNLFMKGCGM